MIDEDDRMLFRILKAPEPEIEIAGEAPRFLRGDRNREDPFVPRCLDTRRDQLMRLSVAELIGFSTFAGLLGYLAGYVSGIYHLLGR